ncbi:hypothetical protein, partial [Empedobacter sp.]|uniref:hypothetical protein n=1 Tax=Empedobacter sp. TaxID=1927715 RepID=UPI0028AA85AD
VIERPFIGLVHLTNNEAISKHDLLHVFNDVYEKGLIITDKKDYLCDKSFINTNKSLNYTVPTYTTMLVEQKEFMRNHKDFYQNIY